MITIATDNCAVSPAIHSQGPRLHLKSSHTAYATQLAHKLRPFYVKQTQFAKARIHLTSYGHKDYEKMRVRQPRKNKPNFPIEDKKC